MSRKHITPPPTAAIASNLDPRIQARLLYWQGWRISDIARLLANAGIIRNRRKIQAAIHNAQQIHRLQQQYGSFKNWLDAHHPRSKEAWVRLFKQQFKFMGNEIVGEFLMSTGYLAGAHDADCPFAKPVIGMRGQHT